MVHHPAGRRPVAEGQAKFPLEMEVVDNTLNPDVKITGDLLPTNK